MPSSVARPLPRAAGASVMLALHAALLVGMVRWSQRPERATPVQHHQAPLIVRLLALRPAAPARADPPEPRPGTTPSRPLAARPPQAITPPAAPDGRAGVPQPDAVAAAATPLAAASTPASAPLDLKLRGGAGATWRAPSQTVFNDPRANTPRATLESRIAAAAGPADWVEERIDDTRVRLRRGSVCVEVHRARNAVLNPWNQSISPTPAMGTACN